MAYFKNSSLLILSLFILSACTDSASVSPVEKTSLEGDPFVPDFDPDQVVDGKTPGDDVTGVNDRKDSVPTTSPLHNRTLVSHCGDEGREELEKQMAIDEALADESGFTVPVKFAYSFGDKHDLLAQFAHDRAILSKSNPGFSYIPVGARNDSQYKDPKTRRKHHLYYIANHDKAKSDVLSGSRCFYSTIKIEPNHREGVISSPRYNFIDVDEADFYKLAEQPSDAWFRKKKNMNKVLWTKHLIHYMYYGYCNNKQCASNGDKFEGEYANRLFDRLPINRENPQVIKLYVADLRSEQIGVENILLTDSSRKRGVEQTKSVKEMLNLCSLNENRQDISLNLSKSKLVNDIDFSGSEGMNQIIHNILNLDTDGTTISTQYTPIVVDLGEKGIRTSSENFGTYFNIAGLKNLKNESLKVPHKTAWLGGKVIESSSDSDSNHFKLVADDGLLVIPNSDGSVTSAFNLFGDKISIDGYAYENGFVALQKLANKDCDSFETKKKYFGPWDEQFTDLVKVWVDKNRNGRSDEGEIKSLNESGVLAINACNIVHAQAQDGFGNGTKLRSALLVKSADDAEVSENEILYRLQTGYKSDGAKADFRVAIDVYFKANKEKLCQFNVQAEEVEVNRVPDVMPDQGDSGSNASNDQPLSDEGTEDQEEEAGTVPSDSNTSGGLAGV